MTDTDCNETPPAIGDAGLASEMFGRPGTGRTESGNDGDPRCWQPRELSGASGRPARVGRASPVPRSVGWPGAALSTETSGCGIFQKRRRGRRQTQEDYEAVRAADMVLLTSHSVVVITLDFEAHAAEHQRPGFESLWRFFSFFFSFFAQNLVCDFFWVVVFWDTSRTRGLGHELSRPHHRRRRRHPCAPTAPPK